MLDSGKITPEEAREHPYRHIITRVVGFTGEAEPDIGVFDFTPQSMVLLCSDGLTNVLEDDPVSYTHLDVYKRQVSFTSL